jgi:hypothetical protein
MSTVSETPILACPPPLAVIAPPLAPVAPPTAEEASPRPLKSALLPAIARWALAGYSAREIGKRVGVPRRTVTRWMQELREEWSARAAEDAALLAPVTLARLELAYREAMDAWQRSLADKETTTESPGDGGGAMPRTCLRRATQSGQSAMLGKVIHAAKEVYAFKEKHLNALRQAETAQSNRLCRELAEELRSLDKSDFVDTRFLLDETSRPAEARDPDELAEAINRLPAEEYRKLRSMLRNDYNLCVPFRRAISCAAEMDAIKAEMDAIEAEESVDARVEDVADSVGAEAAASAAMPGQVPSECGHNPGR